VIGITITVVLILIGDVDKRVENKIADPKFVSKVAAEIRMPMLVFDENERTLVDTGALEYIEKISVKKEEKSIKEILISPKNFLTVAPLITSLSTGTDLYEPERTNIKDWLYKAEESSYIEAQTGGGEKVPKKFRLEVIKPQ
jgi:hypothetical protein